MELTAERAMIVDVEGMIRADYAQAHRHAGEDVARLRDAVLADVAAGKPQTAAIVEHRKAWRHALGLRPLC